MNATQSTALDALIRALARKAVSEHLAQSAVQRPVRARGEAVKPLPAAHKAA